jgi:hypothetical protein
MAFRGVNDKAGRLVDDEDGGVTIEDVEVDPLLRLRLRLWRWLGPELDVRARTHLRGGIEGWIPVDGHPTAGDPPLDDRTRRTLWKDAHEESIEAHAGGFAWNDQTHQIFDLMCPFALMRMSTSARS